MPCLLIMLVTLGTLPAALVAQEQPPVAEPIVVTARRVEEDPFYIPRSLIIVSREEFEERNAGTALDALDQKIGIWVEKRTATTSDPVLCGLSGANLLTLIDGNTLTTFWGEGGFAGDDMYGKIDADTVERIEVLRGPASVFYGSNALGGVINFITRSSPIDYTDGSFEAGSRSKTTIGSAAHEVRQRLETYGAGDTFKYLLGVSYRDVGDLRAGGDVGVQRPTSGRDRNLDAKLQWLPDDHGEVTFSAQSVHRDHIHRFYRPNQDNENFREGYSLTYESDNGPEWWDEARFNLYYQSKEDRRRFFETGNEGVAWWKTATADAQFTRRIGADHRLSFGLGLHRDEGESPDDEQFTITEPDGNTYKAAPDTRWDNAGLFAYDTWALDSRWTVTTGLRYDHFRFESRPDALYANNPAVTDPGLDEISDTQGAVTGGIGASYSLTDAWQLFGDYSRGFRQFAPNFGVRQLANGVLVPNAFLDPVTADNYEVGAKWRTERTSGAIATYYTRLDNFQNLTTGTFQGSAFYDIEGDGIEADDQVLVATGNGQAYVYGIEIESSMRLDALFPGRVGPEWSLSGGVMWNYGNDETNDEPLRHTHPARGLLALRWDDPDPERALWWEVAADVVRHFDRVPSDRISGNDPTYLEDPQDPSKGLLRSDGSLPGYTVFDVRGGVALDEQSSITWAVENVFDKRYRPAHSRMDAPGFGVVLAYERSF
jgi:outer membrane receptor protein involved in Fe transport